MKPGGVLGIISNRRYKNKKKRRNWVSKLGGNTGCYHKNLVINISDLLVRSADSITGQSSSLCCKF